MVFLFFSVSWLHNELNVAMVGHKVDLSYSYHHLGEDVSVLKELANGTHPFCQVNIFCMLQRGLRSNFATIWLYLNASFFPVFRLF